MSVVAVDALERVLDTHLPLSLTGRELFVLTRRFATEPGAEPQTLEAVAAAIPGGPVSRERVRQLEAAALRRLRNERLRQITLAAAGVDDDYAGRYRRLLDALFRGSWPTITTIDQLAPHSPSTGAVDAYRKAAIAWAAATEVLYQFGEFAGKPAAWRGRASWQHTGIYVDRRHVGHTSLDCIGARGDARDDLIGLLADLDGAYLVGDHAVQAMVGACPYCRRGYCLDARLHPRVIAADEDPSIAQRIEPAHVAWLDASPVRCGMCVRCQMPMRWSPPLSCWLAAIAADGEYVLCEVV